MPVPPPDRQTPHSDQHLHEAEADEGGVSAGGDALEEVGVSTEYTPFHEVNDLYGEALEEVGVMLGQVCA